MRGAWGTLLERRVLGVEGYGEWKGEVWLRSPCWEMEIANEGLYYRAPMHDRASQWYQACYPHRFILTPSPSKPPPPLSTLLIPPNPLPRSSTSITPSHLPPPYPSPHAPPKTHSPKPKCPTPPPSTAPTTHNPQKKVTVRLATAHSGGGKSKVQSITLWRDRRLATSLSWMARQHGVMVAPPHEERKGGGGGRIFFLLWGGNLIIRRGFSRFGMVGGS